MIRSNCPKCDRPLRVGDNLAGRMIACPGCKHKFRLPEADESVAELDEEPARPKPVSKKKPRKNRKKKSADKDGLGLRNRIAGGVALVLGMGLVIVGIGGYFPQGAIDRIGEDICKYASIGFGGLLIAAGVVYAIRG